MFWGGVFGQAAGPDPGSAPALIVFVFLPLAALSIPLDRVIRRALARWFGLPPMSITTVFGVWLSQELTWRLDVPFWYWPDWGAFGNTGFGVAAVLGACALWRSQPRAAMVTIAIVGGAALASGAVVGRPVGPPALWASSLIPVSFALGGWYLRSCRRAGLRAACGAAVAALVWALWDGSGLSWILPPLVAPAVLGTWFVLGFHFTARERRLLMDPALHRVAAALRVARHNQRRVIALTGAGISTGAGIPDYVSGAWLDAEVPVEWYDHSHFLANRQARIAYWDACARFRTLAAAARPGAGHRALAALQRHGWLSAVVTQNVDRLHQTAGSDPVIALHGRIDGTRCLLCGWTGLWPDGSPETETAIRHGRAAGGGAGAGAGVGVEVGSATATAGPWHAHDVTCRGCGGWLKPDVVAMGELIEPWQWKAAHAALDNCGVLLVIGTRLLISTAATLADRARHEGALIVVINDGPVAGVHPETDLTLERPIEDVLPALVGLLE